MRRATVMALAIALTLAPSAWAGAQDDEDEDEETQESDSPEDGDEDEGDEDEDADEADADADEAHDEGDGDDEGEAGEDDEKDGKDSAAAGPRKWFFGPYFRYVFVPAFMLELFLEEAPTVGNAAFGIAANYRTDDGPAFQIGIGYTGYSFEDPFRATGDPVTDTEWVDSSIGLVHLTGSILWNAELVPKTLTFEYGIGVDLGVVTGSLVRTEAYQGVAGWQPCQSRGVPNPFYCEQPSRQGIETNAYDEEGAHYGVEEERVPPIGLLPMLPHLALRFDPVEEFAIKVEAAYGIAQLWLGLSAAYAPEL